MELDDLKNIWLKEKEELEGRVALNEKLVREMSLDKSKSLFNKLINGAIMNRDVSFFLMICSIITGTLMLFEFKYSIPTYIGAIAMMVLFFQQMSFQKPDLTNMSTIELQKAIGQFRIYTLKVSKYDVPLGMLWFLSMIPVHFKNISILPILSTITLSIIALSILLRPMTSRKTYEKQDKQLKELEEQLNQIMEFEKNQTD